MRLNRISLAVLAGALLASTAAQAADNAIIITPGSGVTLRSKDIGGGVQSPIDILGDTSGNVIYGIAGTANVNVLTIQGVASMTPVGVSALANAFAVGSGTDGWFTTFGLKADAASAATGSTAMSVWRQIDADINTLNTTAGSALATQAPTVSIGGVGIVDSAGTNVATVKAASTLPVAADKTLVVGLNPGTATAGSPTGAILSIQGVTSGQAVPVSGTVTATVSGVATAANQILDPCSGAKTNVPISTASGTTALVTGVSAKKIYICSLALIAPSVVSVSLSEGSGATCGTSNQAGVIGVATNGTAANGMPLAANGGLTLGNGLGTVAATATAADYLCLFQSGTAQIAGNLTYVQQ